MLLRRWIGIPLVIWQDYPLDRKWLAKDKSHYSFSGSLAAELLLFDTDQRWKRFLGDGRIWMLLLMAAPILISRLQRAEVLKQLLQISWQAKELAWNTSSIVSRLLCTRRSWESDVSAPQTGRPYCQMGMMSCLMTIALVSLGSRLFGPASQSSLAALDRSFVQILVMCELRVIWTAPMHPQSASAQAV
ncbi:uncharacterized protein LOC113567309 [Drosophila persimilis]|uniref:uncharacterized protein LOC113566742 n=1 Tax=Drosophila persimilis TaxID=7234 RepID=UPI000F07478D|nr:uncharacterized protein LOC113566742 [Drosophila persimilis]XP_026849773.1 uncharacterized protein LOC113566810 [Drosophila persimilis]XP_026850443.1 uncharacterized protein LOC113567309 [Drosophila persimilis]